MFNIKIISELAAHALDKKRLFFECEDNFGDVELVFGHLASVHLDPSALVLRFDSKSIKLCKSDGMWFSEPGFIYLTVDSTTVRRLEYHLDDAQRRYHMSQHGLSETTISPACINAWLDKKNTDVLENIKMLVKQFGAQEALRRSVPPHFLESLIHYLPAPAQTEVRDFVDRKRISRS